VVQKLKHAFIEVSADEREAFLAKNSIPANEAEGFIWFSFSNAECGVVELFSDELTSAAEMARKAGMEELANRILDGGSDVIP
jgi:hypothetical protein